MILRSVMRHVRDQNWFAVGIDFMIVVVGVFIGIQVANWNESRAADARKAEIIAALITDLEDARFVQEGLQILAIDAGIAAWNVERGRGGHPPPFVYRIDGSETAPDTWAVIQQMEIAGLFDPVMVFDLNFYYSELAGVGRRYVRYVEFVEREILPYLDGDPMHFYSDDGLSLRPEYRASMDRLLEYRNETRRLSRWAACLIGRLRSDTASTESCLRADPSITNRPLPASSPTERIVE